MRSLIFAAILAAPLYAETPAELELKAKAYLLLASKPAPSELPNDCGECRFDEDEARAAAKRDKKPLVIFVGGCRGLGKAALANGAEAVIVKEYAGDKTPRAVVLSSEGEKWFIHETLKKDATERELLDAIGKAKPAPASSVPSLDWYLLNSQNCPTCRAR